MRRFVAVGPSLVVLLTLCALLLGAPAVVQRLGHAQQQARVVLAREALTEDDILERMNAANRRVIEIAEPSVVHIEVGRGERGMGFRRSSGSGWIYDAEGHIVTNAHVVGGSKSVTVQFFDGRTDTADVVATPDVLTDIAVLKLRGSGPVIPAMRASGEEARKGDRVFVFGSPFGFKFSVSSGIVSGLGRDANTPGAFNQFTNFIQTDAAVNPGNSGGPLVDVKGRVIGMNVAIATGRDAGDSGEQSETGQSAGISFAIPLGTIESVVDQVVGTGRVARGYFGVVFGEGRYFPAIQRRGIRIEEVVPDGPCDRGGMKVNDIVTKIAGVEAISNDVARSVITAKRPGETIDVAVVRDGQSMDLRITLGEFPRERLVRSAFLQAMREYGAEFSDSSRDPVIARVISDSAAERQGLRSFQMVVRVGTRDVANMDDLLIALDDLGFLAGRSVEITVRPDGEAGKAGDRSITIQLNR